MTVAVNKECTRSIQVGRGVLQGDPCSPLLFNICFNTLMLTLKQPKYASLGYLWSTPTGKSNECRWLQFADDAIVITNNDKTAQVFLNIFTAWCQWAQVKIRLDKCSAFGMRKEEGTYDQYNPKIFINNEQVPVVKHHEDFIYLGKYFNYNMNKDRIKTELSNKLKSLINIVSDLKIKPQLKLKLLKFAIYPKLRFSLKTYQFSST